jgi:hypothetical protein
LDAMLKLADKGIKELIALQKKTVGIWFSFQELLLSSRNSKIKWNIPSVL